MSSSLRFLSSLLVLGGVAHADNRFQVEPTRVDLSAQSPAGALVVTNHGADPLRIQVEAMHWVDDADGNQQLTATKDIAIRPSLVEIPAGKSKTIRVGTLVGAADVEGSYRVFIEELPDHTRPQSAQIQVLTRLAVPVFTAAKVARVDLGSKVVGGAVVVENRGTQHVKLSKIRVFDKEIVGWYVLPGATRKFVVPAAECRDGKAHVELVDEDGGARANDAPCE